MKTYKIIWHEKYNRWQCNAQKDDERRSFTSSVKGREGKAIVAEKVSKWMDEGLSDRQIKFEQLCDLWEKNVELKIGKGQRATHKSLIKNWIKPIIGNKKVHNLNSQDLQNVIDNAFNSGLSKYSITDIRSTLSKILKYARKSNKTKLTLLDVESPKDAPVRKKIILDVEHVKKLFESNKTVYRKKEYDEWCIHAFRAFTLSGLRPGELVGLKWSAITDETTSIKQAINQQNEVTPGKNKRARRTFPNIDLLQYEYEAQRDMLRSKGLIIPCISDGKTQEKYLTEYVFPQKNGKPLTQFILTAQWKRYKKHNNLPDVSLYGFRHTFTSHNKTMPEELMKIILGHSPQMDTYGTYGQEVSGDKESAKGYIEANFNKILK